MSSKPYLQDKLQNSRTRRDPAQFALYLGMGICLLTFLGVFAFLFRQQRLAETTVQLRIPSYFWLSTIILMISSVSFHEALISFRNEKFRNYRIAMVTSLATAAGFILLQVLGCIELAGSGEPGSVAAYAFFLLTGMHGLVLSAGLTFLAILTFDALRHYSYIDAFVYSVNAPNQQKLILLVHYWHFLNILWVFTFLFLIYFNS